MNDAYNKPATKTSSKSVNDAYNTPVTRIAPSDPTPRIQDKTRLNPAGEVCIKPVMRGQLRSNVITAIFVPKTPGGSLAKAIQVKDDELTPQIGWSAKILEKPGVPLSNLFVKRFNMLEGCYRGSNCICGGGGSKCTVKGVV